MLEYVDEHDDTIFNQSQMRAVIPKLLAEIEEGLRRLWASFGG